MELLLAQVTHQAMNYAIRSGIAITSAYAIKQCGRLLKEIPRSEEREELARLQLRLESKIRVISPSIDMIDLIAARGNTTLESAVSLTKDIRYQIQRLGVRLSSVANDEQLLDRKSSRARSQEVIRRELSGIILEIKAVLARIEDSVPLINLAITTSGINLSTKMSGNVSPSRLLQASTFLTAADTAYTGNPYVRQQVGPTYTLSVYMLFAGHARPVDNNGVRETTWKEVFHKCRMKLWRVPLAELYSLPGEVSDGTSPSSSLPADNNSVEFAYQLVLIEDLDDERVHEVETAAPLPDPIDGVSNAGIREVVPVHEISKIFYADTGKILNIGGEDNLNNPVLLLKRDIEAEPPRQMLQQSQSFQDILDQVTERDDKPSQTALDHVSETSPQAIDPQPTRRRIWRLPPDLDPEWMAFEVYSEQVDSESEDESPSEDHEPPSHRSNSLDPGILSGLSNLVLNSSPAASSASRSGQLRSSTGVPSLTTHDLGRTQLIKTNLSLLEMLLKLTALQQFRQESHLTVEDELLNFFLEESSTAETGGDKHMRQKIRHDAMRRVGFDPYDESPVKRRGEQYIRHTTHSPSNWNRSGSRPTSDLAYDDEYEYDQPPLASPRLRPVSSNEGACTPEHRIQSSPRSRPLPYPQTPSRSSTLDLLSDTRVETNSDQSAVHRIGLSPTPPSAKRYLNASRLHSRQTAQSPLSNELTNDETQTI